MRVVPATKGIAIKMHRYFTEQKYFFIAVSLSTVKCDVRCRAGVISTFLSRLIGSPTNMFPATKRNTTPGSCQITCFHEIMPIGHQRCPAATPNEFQGTSLHRL